MSNSHHLRLGEELMVAESPVNPTWGHYCFPQLTRLPDQRILLSYHVADDHMDNYGESGWAHQVSTDEGISWQPIDGPYSRFHHHLKLPSGEIISVPERPPIDISQMGMDTSGLITFASYDNQYYPCPLYKRASLPPDLQTLPLWRWSAGQWSASPAPLEAPDSLHFAYEGRMPLIYFGQMRQFDDGEIVAAFYPNIALDSAGSYDPKQSIAIYSSKDEGHSWSLRSRIRYEPCLSYDSLGELRGGFTEPSLTICKDGSLLCALRCTDATPGLGPLYLSRSLDRGASWSTPWVTHPYGVMPQLLRLTNGMLLLSYGRPGVQVRLSADGSGELWSAPRDVVAAEHSEPRGDSCGYSALLELKQNRALIAYSRFRAQRHSIYVRTVTVQDLADTEPLTQPLPELATNETMTHEWNGKLFSRIPLRQGVVDGVVCSYYGSDALAVQTPLKKGVISGTQRYYWPKGGLMKECSWQGDLPHGARRLYDSLGNITSERVYIDGKVSSHEAWWDR